VEVAFAAEEMFAEDVPSLVVHDPCRVAGGAPDHDCLLIVYRYTLTTRVHRYTMHMGAHGLLVPSMSAHRVPVVLCGTGPPVHYAHTVRERV
jgi:hypothetical protein